jgi:hypothetical protein
MHVCNAGKPFVARLCGRDTTALGWVYLCGVYLLLLQCPAVTQSSLASPLVLHWSLLLDR